VAVGDYKRQALLEGIDYKHVLQRKHWLPGIIDVLNFKKCLNWECDLADNTVKILSDKDRPLKRETILESLQILVKGAKVGDQLFFYVSKHGIKFCGFDKNLVVYGLLIYARHFQKSEAR
jgi:hypothetical protein